MIMPEVNCGESKALMAISEPKPAVLRKRRSCDLVNTPSPCVKKALFHLSRLKELLRLALESPQTLQVVSEQVSYDDYMDNHPAKGWKELRFDIPKLDQSRTESSLSSINSDTSGKNTELAITGIGGQIQDPGSGEKIIHVSQLEKKNQLRPPEVFTQVRDLILRLEDDRMQTQFALQMETEKVSSLSEKIDKICQKRLLLLPLAVQKEHDACATDISELQWHVGYMGRQLDRYKHRVEVAEVLNTQLKDDIAFVKKHCPLVEEKLALEKNAMQKIKQLQAKTDGELHDAKMDLQKAESNYQDASERAESERQATRTKLEGIRSKLYSLKKDLQHAEALHTAYLKKANESQQKFESQELELESLQKRAEEAKDEEQEEVYKIENLRFDIKQVEFETGEINKRKAMVENDTEKLHEDMATKISDLETKYHESLKNLRNMQEENRDLKLDIEDMNEEIKTCDKSISKSSREMDRYEKERQRCEAQLQKASAEVQRVTVINTELKVQLQKEESKSLAIEDALKNQSESLRKRVMEEMRQRTALEVKKQANSHALQKGRSDNKKRRNKVVKTLKDTEESVTKIREDVERLKKQHETTTKEVVELETKLAMLKEEHDKEERTLTAQKDTLIPQEKELFRKQMSLQDQIKELEFEESQMSQKMKDMIVSKNAMEKRIITTEASIESLNLDLEEITLRLETGKVRNEDLQKQLEEAKQRLAVRQLSHNKMMGSRRKMKASLEEGIEKELSRNRDLAQKYRDLQSQHIDLKNRLMSLYDNKVKIESSIKDHKQLVALQEKFNVALKQYYHDRGEFNKAGLKKFHHEAEDNSAAMVKVQSGLHTTLAYISKFLKGQIQGDAANKVHEDAMNVLLTEAKV